MSQAKLYYFYSRDAVAVRNVTASLKQTHLFVEIFGTQEIRNTNGVSH